jgi:hypothetical protein
MRKLEMSINAGIGDSLIVRTFFDAIKHNYDQIMVSYNQQVLDAFKPGNVSYKNFLNELGQSLFSNPPYVFNTLQYPPLNVYGMVKSLNIVPQKLDLDHVLCQGMPLNIGEYLVISTKIRGIEKHVFNSMSHSLWNALNMLSKTYKIVILGERYVEPNKEYNKMSSQVFSIYDQIVANIPAEQTVDLSVPALGATTPDFGKIKQDCLIMKNAKFVITLGVGGNLWMALSVANVVGFRGDNGAENNYVNDKVSCLTNPKFTTSFISQNWEQFIGRLQNYQQGENRSMRVLNVGGIPLALGEIVNFKHHLDLIKNQYNQIRLGFYTPLFQSGLNTTSPDWPQKKQLWDKYLNDIGALFFSEPPYVLETNPGSFVGDVHGLIAKLNLRPQKPELGHLLCKGNSLNIGEYIVITTKVREMQRYQFDQIATQFWNIINEISKKYKVVILGEKMVEMRKEYMILNPRPFGIYEDIIRNLPPERIVDLSVSALGETVSDLTQIQQDCLTMKEAKFTLSFGCGGNYCLSSAVSDMAIGYRTDNFNFNDAIFNYREYPNAIIAKDPEHFLETLRHYI